MSEYLFISKNPIFSSSSLFKITAPPDANGEQADSMPTSAKHWENALDPRYQNGRTHDQILPPGNQVRRASPPQPAFSISTVWHHIDMAFTQSSYPYLTFRIFSYEEKDGLE